MLQLLRLVLNWSPFCCDVLQLLRLVLNWSPFCCDVLQLLWLVLKRWSAVDGQPGQATRQPVSLTTWCGSSSQSKCVWSAWPQAPLTTLGGATEKGQGCGGPWGPSLWRRKTSAGYVSNTRHHTDKRHRPQNQLRIKPERQHCYKFTSRVESLRETYSLWAWLFHPPFLPPPPQENPTHKKTHLNTGNNRFTRQMKKL